MNCKSWSSVDYAFDTVIHLLEVKPLRPRAVGLICSRTSTRLF